MQTRREHPDTSACVDCCVTRLVELSVHCATVANINCSEEKKILQALILTQCNNRNLGLWMEEILHHVLGFQFIGQAAMSPHPLFNIGR